MPKKWNVLIIPSSAHQKTLGMEISSRLIWTAVFVAVCVLIISLALIFYSGHKWKTEKMARISELESVIKARDAEFSRLQQEYSILEQLEDKLRTIAGLKPRERSNPNATAGGQGGSYADIPGEPAFSSDFMNISQQAVTPPSTDELLGYLRELRDSYEEILSVFERESARLSNIPSINPVVSQEAWISSGFGSREDPFSGARRFHEGCDIVAPRGTPVIAPADGIVVFAGWRDGLGRTIEIEHGYGYTTLYGHNDKLFVKKNDLVKRGDLIANLGSSGRSTGPHLHYEVHHHDRLVNPYKYVME